MIHLTEEDRNQLESWVRKKTMEQRFVERARIVLEASTGKTTKEIAHSLKRRPATVSKWRTRFARQGMTGLSDMPRLGKTAKYDRSTERRILAQMDSPPPAGYATWTGGLLARALGDVSPHQVWWVLRRHGIHLQRRRSWCVSADPEFAQKAADIVGLYLDPPENAVVISVDYADTELHVILDNLNTHKPKHDRWLVRHPNVHFHYTPAHASWLNQVECWFSILWRGSPRGLSVVSPRQVHKAIDAFTKAYCHEAHPFEWTKHVVPPGQLKRSYADLCN